MKYIAFAFMMFFMIWQVQVQHESGGPDNLNRNAGFGNAIEHQVPPPRQETSVKLLPIFSRHFFNVFACRDIVLDSRCLKPLDTGVYEYRWFINEFEIAEANDHILSKDLFQAGDRVYCRVKAVDLDSTNFRNPQPVEEEFYYTVMNSPPLLNLPPIGHLRVPGHFTYTIKARDPDPLPGSDGELQYKLVSPDDAGIKLNSRTGEIDWMIDREAMSRYPEGVRIRFKVIDAAGSEAGGIINLNFFPEL